jgi:OmpA-OmpF porin, OOP family
MRCCVPLLLILTSSVALADNYEIKDNELVVPHSIAYDTGKATLQPSSDAALAHVKGYLAAKSYISTLRIEVHTDSMGNDDFNQKLSEKRALEVAKALVAKGVDCKRLVAVGFGETKPIADNKTPEGRSQNRRTQFFNAALRGKAIGGMPTDGGGKIAGDPCN